MMTRLTTEIFKSFSAHVALFVLLNRFVSYGSMFLSMVPPNMRSITDYISEHLTVMNLNSKL